MRGIFVTATDTGVGKTHVGQRVISVLRGRGVPVRPRKPVESGCPRDPQGTLLPADALALQQAAGGAEPLSLICPYRFEAAVSPARAARLGNTPLPLDDLVDACLADVRDDDFLWAEGAGGYYSPIADGALNADLADRLGLPLLIVAPDRLGAVGQILLTLEAAARRGNWVAGVVLNAGLAGNRPAELDNAAELAERSDVTLWRLPRTGPNAEGGMAIAAIADACLRQSPQR